MHLTNITFIFFRYLSCASPHYSEVEGQAVMHLTNITFIFFRYLSCTSPHYIQIEDTGAAEGSGAGDAGEPGPSGAGNAAAHESGPDSATDPARTDLSRFSFIRTRQSLAEIINAGKEPDVEMDGRKERRRRAAKAAT
jgi:hypothetical protein